MATNLIARRNGSWVVISKVPDVCLTFIGAICVPVPYQVFASLQQAYQTTTNVNVNGDPIVVFDSSFVPMTQGGEAGTQGGIMSGTTAQKTRALQHSNTMKCQGEFIARAEDLFSMNGP